MSKPILPLPGGSFLQQQPPQGGQSQAPGGSSGSPQPPGQGKPTYSKRGKITIVACVPCRKRKTKCDGKRPECTQCQSREGQCHYDMSEEQRRLTYLRENVEHLAEEKNNLEALIWNLRTSSEEEAAEILRRLRAGTDPHTLTQHIQAGRSLAQVRRDNISPQPTASSVQSLIDPSILPNAGQPARADQYESLVNTIAASSPVEVDEIVRRLRLHENIGNIITSARSGTLLQQLTGRDIDMGTGLEGSYSSREQTFGLTRVGSRGDNELQQSRAPDAHTPLTNHNQWTTVTDDYEFVDHLISVYFTWQHAFFQSFPENLFRQDMAAGRTKYCSKFLVNAICAAGALLSTHPKARRDQNDPKSADMGFFDEAVRLLQHDEQTSSIPTVAGLFLLCHVEGYRGRLSMTWGYCGQSSRMALDLNLHLRSERSSDAEVAKSEEIAKLHTFWGCFIADQVTSFTLGRLPQIPTNAVSVDLPPILQEDDDEPWIAYGVNLPPRPGARSTTFYEVATLSKIVNSTLLMFFAPSQTIKGSLLLNEYEKYQSWFRRLPPMVVSIENAPPHVLCLHMYYHAAVLLLFRPFLKAKFTESDLSPSEVCRQSANRIGDIFAMHRQLYDTTGIYTFQLQCLLTACTIHIINIPTISSTAYLTAACNHFHDLIPRNEWATGSLSIIKGLVQKWNIILPQEAEVALYRNHANLEEPSFLDDSAGLQAEIFRPQKRAAFLSPSSDSVSQKRQKLTPQGFTASAQQTASRSSVTPSREGQQQGQASYLFAPFPNQPAPLLGPIHTSTSADTAWNDELNKVAQGFDGLKFEGDGWLDPFMGYSFLE